MAILMTGEFSIPESKEDDDLGPYETNWSGNWKFVKEKKEQDFSYTWISDQIPLDLVHYVSFISTANSLENLRNRLRRKKKRKGRTPVVKLKTASKKKTASIDSSIHYAAQEASSSGACVSFAAALQHFDSGGRSDTVIVGDDARSGETTTVSFESCHAAVESDEFEEPVLSSAPLDTTGGGDDDQVDEDGGDEEGDKDDGDEDGSVTEKDTDQVRASLAASEGDINDVETVDAVNEEGGDEMPPAFVKLERSDPLFGLWKGSFSVESTQLNGAEIPAPPFLVEETFFLYAYAGSRPHELPTTLQILPPEQFFSIPLLLNVKPTTKPKSKHATAAHLASQSRRLPVTTPYVAPMSINGEHASIIKTEGGPSHETFSSNGTQVEPSATHVGSMTAPSNEEVKVEAETEEPAEATAYETAIMQSKFILGFGRNMYGRYSLVCYFDEDKQQLRCEKRYMVTKQGNSRKFRPKSLPSDSNYRADHAENGKRKRTPKSKYFADALDDDFFFANGTNIMEAEDMRKARHPRPVVFAAHDEKNFRDAFFDEMTGEIYEGDCIGLTRHGRGVCLYSDGSMYEGGWDRGLEHGRGRLMKGENRELIYSGGWFEGNICGSGTYVFSNGDKYSGEFRDGVRSGYGEYIMHDGSKYAGEWLNNQRHGKGVFTWSNGSFYDGEWERDQRHGKGVLDIVGGMRYEGSWCKNYMDGKGVAVYPGGQMYQGSFKMGLREGRGSVSFVEGAVYEGRFRDDKIDGQGTLHMTSITRGVEEGERMIPVHIQADLKRIHMRAGFIDDQHH